MSEREASQTNAVLREIKLGSYLAGFGISILLTLGAYLLVRVHVASGHTVFTDSSLIGLIAALAVTQLFVQLFFFLHVGKESGPKWNLLALIFAVTTVIIVVFGSLWIMYNLGYHHSHPMTPSQTNQYLQSQDGL